MSQGGAAVPLAKESGCGRKLVVVGYDDGAETTETSERSSKLVVDRLERPQGSGVLAS